MSSGSGPLPLHTSHAVSPAVETQPNPGQPPHCLVFELADKVLPSIVCQGNSEVQASGKLVFPSLPCKVSFYSISGVPVVRSCGPRPTPEPPAPPPNRPPLPRAPAPPPCPPPHPRVPRPSPNPPPHPRAPCPAPEHPAPPPRLPRPTPEPWVRCSLSLFWPVKKIDQICRCWLPLLSVASASRAAAPRPVTTPIRSAKRTPHRIHTGDPGTQCIFGTLCVLRSPNQTCMSDCRMSVNRRSAPRDNRISWGIPVVISQNCEVVSRGGSEASWGLREPAEKPQGHKEPRAPRNPGDQSP